VKVIVYRQRARRVPGLATGLLLVTLASQDPEARRTERFWGAQAPRTVKKVARRLHTVTEDPLFGARGSFRIVAEVRASNGGLRRVFLTSGELPRDVERALDCLRRKWLPIAMEAPSHEPHDGWVDSE